MPRLIAALLALVSLTLTGPAYAWGDYGHHTVASIAMANVSPRTAARVRVLLAAEKGLGTPYCAVRSLEDAAYWPDCIRKEGWRWGYTFPWHYQTEPVCSAYDPRANCANGNCVSAQIERSRRVLADRHLPAAQRLEALAFLSHFVGDIHMPLHSGDNGDAGGNGVAANYGIAPAHNIHFIWDVALAERAISSATPPLVRRYSADERADLAGGDVAQWGEESWKLARETVYPLAFGHDPCGRTDNPKTVTWSEDAIAAATPALRRRVVQAGLRLARLLDEALGG
ncbi:MAG: S1/P1 nuclease [Sphingomonadales bacterium]|nr:S1/P1 nuclease [Sphingomonadales bacterium]